MRSAALLCLLQLHAVVQAFSGYHEAVGIPKARLLMEWDIAPRYAGGSPVEAISHHPFQAGIIITLTSGETSLCGGALVSTKRVVTAAHCWNDGRSQARQFTVVLGTLTIFSEGTRVTTRDVTIHSKWNPKSLVNDIAMVKFPDIKLNNNIQAVPLPAAADVRETFAGLSSIASGYGKTRDSQTSFPPSTTLHDISLKIITNEVCRRSFEVKLDSSHLCTCGGSGVGTCDGDSGGPLTVMWKNKRILVGIVSFGFGDSCAAGYPSVYTRVTSFLTWIQSEM